MALCVPPVATFCFSFLNMGTAYCHGISGNNTLEFLRHDRFDLMRSGVRTGALNLLGIKLRCAAR